MNDFVQTLISLNDNERTIVLAPTTDEYYILQDGEKIQVDKQTYKSLLSIKLANLNWRHRPSLTDKYVKY